MLYQFCDSCKILSFTHQDAEMKSSMITHYYEHHRKNKKFKSLYGLVERCLNITDVCIDFEQCFKVYNLVSDYLKSIKLGWMTALNWPWPWPWPSWHLLFELVYWLNSFSFVYSNSIFSFLNSLHFHLLNLR